MATHRLVIADWTPSNLNSYQGKHWSAKAKAKQADRLMVQVAAHNAGIPPATSKRSLAITVTVTGRGRLPDGDNLLKGLLDSCTHAGLIVDDSQAWCEWSRPVVVRGKQRFTVLEITDIEREDTD